MRLGLLGLLGLLVVPASAQALTLSADIRDTGWVGLRVADGRRHQAVTIEEGGKLVARLQLDASGATTARRVLAWRCDRRVRQLTAGDPEGDRASAEVTTPGCGHRIELGASPSRPRAGHALTVVLRDRWNLGDLLLELCLTAPVDAHRCRPVTVGAHPTPIALRAPRPGRWTIVAKGPGVEARRALVVGPHARRLTILAAGDSMVRSPAAGLRSLLAGRRGFGLEQDVEPGTGISKPLTDWRQEATRWTATHKPDVVVFFLGWNEGYSFGSIRCCGLAWIDEWARRARQMMGTYARGGAAQVYWLTLPAFRRDRLVVPAVNAALGQAVQGLDSGIRLLNMSALFTPGLIYRPAMPVRGRLTVVRAPDGIHLNREGGQIAADAILRAMRRDGILRPGRIGNAARAGRAGIRARASIRPNQRMPPNAR